MQRTLFPVVVGLVLLVAAAAGAWWWLEGRHIRTTDNAYVEADIAVIAPRVAGYVAEVAVEDNQAVRKGDVLVRIADSDWRAAVARAEAELERMERLSGAARANVAAVRSGIAESEAELRAAEAEAVRARADMARAEELMTRGFATRALVDARRAELGAAEARVAERRAALAAVRASRLAATDTAGGEAAAVSAARAALESARVDLANTVIRAPTDGIVGNRTARVGQYARTGQQLMVVVPVEAAYLVANFKETQVAGMRVGQPVEVRLDGWPDTRLAGRIESFAPATGSRFSVIPPENATGNFTRVVQRVPVKIRIDRPLPGGVRLVPGLSARVRVDMRKTGEA